MLSRLSLVALASVAAVPAALVSGQTCFEPGVCVNSFQITAETQEDANNCLFSCQNTTSLTDNYDCTWFNYSPDTGACFLYTECDTVGVDEVRCPNCIHGESTCEPVYVCDEPGQCQGVAFGLNFPGSRDECVQGCKDYELGRCLWWSYNPENNYCNYFETCESQDVTAVNAVYGQKDCALSNAESSYHLVFMSNGQGGSGNSSEVLNMMAGFGDEPCPSPADYPVNMNGGGGGYSAMNEKIIVCGGSIVTTPTNDCYEYDPLLDTWTERLYNSLIFARSEVAYTKIDEDRFWISGGWGGSNYLTSTEYYDATFDRFYSGPVLPRSRGDHCIVKVNTTQYLFVGGLPYSTEVFMYEHVEGASFTSGTWTQKTSIPESRAGPFCGAITRTDAFTGQTETEVVVAAGFSGSSYARTTYVYNVNDDAWRVGTAYPEQTDHGTSVPFGDTFITIDGSGDPDNRSVYQYVVGSTGYDYWSLQTYVETAMDRYFSVGFLIPDHLYQCEAGTGATTTTTTPWWGR